VNVFFFNLKMYAVSTYAIFHDRAIRIAARPSAAICDGIHRLVMSNHHGSCANGAAPSAPFLACTYAINMCVCVCANNLTRLEKTKRKYLAHSFFIVVVDFMLFFFPPFVFRERRRTRYKTKKREKRCSTVKPPAEKF
jgi:hypothetical protein